jgi:hypothetical protein
VEVVIFEPPAAPVTNRTFPVDLSTIITGLIEESGRFPGLMKLFGDGGKLKSLVMFGDEKSSISSLKMIPVDGDIIREPKLKKQNIFLCRDSFAKTQNIVHYCQKVWS